MILRTATRGRISSPRQRRLNLYGRKTSAIDHAVRVVHGVCCLAGAASLVDDIRAELRAEGIPSAIRRHDTGTLFDWLMSALSYQGISDQVAYEYMERHGRARWNDIEDKVSAPNKRLLTVPEPTPATGPCSYSHQSKSTPLPGPSTVGSSCARPRSCDLIGRL